MKERLRISAPADLDRLLHEKEFRADHPFRISRRILGASTLDLEGSEHRARKREWWASFGKRWTDNDATQEMVNSAVAEGFARAHANDDLLQSCVHIPNRVVLNLLGLPDVDPVEHYESLKPVLRALGGFAEPEDRVAQAKEYMRQLAREATGPLFSDLPDEIRATELALFLVAGAETTVVALEVMTFAWWNDADAVADDVRCGGSGNTVMRLLAQDAPLGVTTRYASREILFSQIGQIPRGAIIDVDLASASLLSHPGGTDAHHSPRGYVFGAGTHRCPGDRLAMLEARAYLEGLVELDASEYAPVVAAEPRPTTFRHPAWQALKKTTNSGSGSPGASDERKV